MTKRSIFILKHSSLINRFHLIFDRFILFNRFHLIIAKSSHLLWQMPPGYLIQYHDQNHFSDRPISKRAVKSPMPLTYLPKAFPCQSCPIPILNSFFPKSDKRRETQMIREEMTQKRGQKRKTQPRINTSKRITPCSWHPTHPCKNRHLISC